MKTVVVGQGYVGLPVAMRAVEVGHDVVGIDLDRNRVGLLKAGSSYVDDISDETLAEATGGGRYLATLDYAYAEGFDVAVITVPTPLRDSLPDLSFIEQAAASLAPFIRGGSTVVLESTTYPGTTDELLVPILESGSGLVAGVDFFVGYSPERIDPGNKTWGFRETPKVVSGMNPESLLEVQAFYSQLVDSVVPVSGTREAELTKLLENTFRHVNIALVNELAIFAHQLGVDVWESIDAASSKPFGFMKFTPGPGVGGHCLPVDPSYLSWQVRKQLGKSFRFVELANDVNDHMPDYVVQRAMTMLNDRSRAVRGARIALVGLAYKPNTGDIREAPSARVIELLTALGADLGGLDSHVEEHRWPQGVERLSTLQDAMAGADLVIVLTHHADVDLEALVAEGVPVFDARNVLTGPSVQRL
ncbi:nucleotide sugar dehydrogenase [Frigoribacterium sp. PhB24]|uniref:nucleotide sugar dehydrogenase n=1 Tax=Frigoribacterium sp. PhB24 TaxID=2485204 RepID=UPI000F48850E|nr:nucleotide sugar dehydrogenase [Frigoribacterium sp. PhB24]ROS54739.1 UDP-N-acetyl-D-mannosaminuronic acid dehydrogenase/UDP-N-acetyl-D-glucosamine dehydrogenase [Frigoribacterium sp. PhB24]